MNTSLFELFKIGIGPSSSHTVGPMRAALRFLRECESVGVLPKIARVRAELYGSLALTGVGHATDRAVLLGLLGESPDTVKLEAIDAMVARVRGEHLLRVMGHHDVRFVESDDLLFHRNQMYPEAGVATHPNGMRFTAFDASGDVLAENVYYSIGGGFVLSASELEAKGEGKSRAVPFPFHSSAELLRVASENKLTIAELMMANEVALLGDASITRRIDRIVSPVRPGNEAARSIAALGPEDQIRSAVLTLWHVMEESINRGMVTEGILPGGLKVRRRAPGLAKRLEQMDVKGQMRDPLAPMDSLTLVAMAVNEENAAGGRVVTAPTNGAAGVVPAIAYFYLHHGSHGLSAAEKEAGLLRFFLTAGAIGILYKENASISGAEVGCQGEVGVACSMAAGGLVAAFNGGNEAVEHAAEIGMEHNLGMTCDPIGGLVQIPCIERNGMGAVKAVNAARLSMNDPGTHKISLDQIIETMYRT
ncbi:MAG: L-serine ammonia-lyase, partial [Bryocella sp.]